MKSEVTVCTKCFNTLGIDSRMKIYRFLKEKGENTVSAVVDVVKLTQPTVSYHLKEMRDAGLLSSKKTGKEVHYSVNRDCPDFHEECIMHKVTFPGKHIKSN